MAGNNGPATGAQFHISLMGPFRLEGPGGVRIAVTSKRSQALLALLCTSPKGERTRGWLETILWCDRASDQAKASLRKELSNLRKLIANSDVTLIDADNHSVRLDLKRIRIDLHNGDIQPNEQFLEGLDIPGAEAFEDWLRAQRGVLETSQLVGGDDVAVPSSDPVTGGPNLEDEAPHHPAHLGLAIAVLPFRIEPSSPAFEYSAYGLGEELINRLSRLRWLPVIGRSSSFSLGTEPIDPRTAGLALGARYIVEGAIRHGGGAYRLSVGLVDADTGQSLWSQTVSVTAIEDDAMLDTLLDGITAALDHRIDQSEQRRALASKDGNVTVRGLIWKARWHLVRLTDADLAIAQDLLDQAEALNPASADVLIEKAWLTTRRLWLHRGSEDDIRAMRKAAQNAILADPDDARGHMIAGIAEFWLHQPLRAEGLLRRAVELNPSLVMAHAQLGSALHHKGDTKRAIAALEIARRLSPNDFDLFFTEGELAMAHLAEGNWKMAIDHADVSLARRAAYWSSHLAKINALVALERLGEAHLAYQDMMAAQPQFRPEFINWLPYRDEARNAALLHGLNLAREAND